MDTFAEHTRKIHGADVDCGEFGATWDNRNPYTAGRIVEKNQRIDVIMISDSMAEAYDVVYSSVVMNEAPFPSDHFATFSVLRAKENGN